MTKAEFDEMARTNCPHCAAGLEVRQRLDTKEFVHDHTAEGSHRHTICWSNGMRQSEDKFVPSHVATLPSSA